MSNKVKTIKWVILNKLSINYQQMAQPMVMSKYLNTSNTNTSGYAKNYAVKLSYLSF